MRKFIKKSMCGLLLLAMTATGFSACTPGEGAGGNSAYDPTKEIQMKIVYENKGYGRDWLQQSMNAYVAKNPNVSIALEERVEMALENDFELGAHNEVDMYIGNVAPGYYAYQGSAAIKGYEEAFVDLTELYSTENPYDSSKTIKEKLTDNGYIDYMGYHYDNTNKVKYYYLPCAGGASGWLYNSDIITDISTVNTTDKLIDYIYNGQGGTYSTVMWSKEGVEYMEYVMNIWIAQYEGKEGFDAIYNMRQNGEDFSYEAYVKEGTLEAFKVGQQILQYERAYGRDLQFMAANSEFSHGAAALMPCGNWFASELTKTEDESVDIATTPIKYMKAPVISSIINVLPDESIKDDATLSAVVSAIDKGEASYAGVSEDDFSVIKEARNTTYAMGLTQRAVIPSSSDQIETAKDFLQFLASEEASEIFRAQTNTDNAFTTDYTAEYSPFLNSFIEAEKDAVPILGYEFNSKFLCEKGLSRYCGTISSSASLNFTVKDGGKYKYDAQALYELYNKAIKKIFDTNL